MKCFAFHKYKKGTDMKKKISITLNSPLVLVFVMLCFIVTLIGIFTKGASTRLVFMTYRSSLLDPLTYLRFFTHVLGHADLQHFFGNACYLLILGPMLEEKHGAKILFFAIIITAFISSLINFIFFPNVALCGASGVVFAFIVLASFTGFRQGEIPLTFLLVLVIYIGQQVLQGLFTKDNISQMAHIVGGLVGAVIGYLVNRKK